jgi:hypothetical protein
MNDEIYHRTCDDHECVLNLIWPQISPHFHVIKRLPRTIDIFVTKTSFNQRCEDDLQQTAQKKE